MPKLRLEGDASGAIRAVTDLHKAQANLLKGGKEVEKQSERLTGALRTTANRAKADWQKYNEELQRLAVLVKKGALNQHQADAAAKKYYQTAFKGAIAEKQAAKDALAARHAEQQAAAIAAQQKRQNIEAAIRLHHIRKSERSALEARNRALKDAARAAKEAELADKRAFGPTALAMITNYAAGWLSVGSAIGVVTAAWRNAEQAAQQAVQNSMSSLASLGEIAQLTDDPQKAIEIASFGKELIRRGIFKPSEGDAAYRLAFDLENAAYTPEEKDFLLQVGESRMVRSGGLLEMGSQLRKVQDIFGVKETGSLENIMDKLILAANETIAGLSEVGVTVPDWASSAKRLGITDEEALAGFVAIEKQSKNPEVASTKFRSLMDQIESKDLIVNNDLTDTMEAIRQRVEKGERLVDILPESRARSAATDLFGSLEYEKQTVSALDYVTLLSTKMNSETGLFAKQRNVMFEADPTFRAGVAAERSAGKLASVDEMLAERQSLFNAVRDEDLAYTQQNYGSLVRGLKESHYWLMDAMGAEDRMIREGARYGDRYDFDSKTVEDLKEYMRRTAEGIESLNTKRPVTIGREKVR